MATSSTGCRGKPGSTVQVLVHRVNLGGPRRAPAQLLVWAMGLKPFRWRLLMWLGKCCAHNWQGEIGTLKMLDRCSCDLRCLSDGGDGPSCPTSCFASNSFLFVAICKRLLSGNLICLNQIPSAAFNLESAELGMRPQSRTLSNGHGICPAHSDAMPSNDIQKCCCGPLRN